jgi:hypothetical protein
MGHRAVVNIVLRETFPAQQLKLLLGISNKCDELNYFLSNMYFHFNERIVFQCLLL